MPVGENRIRLFAVPANKARVQTFACAGFARPVVGTVYPRASFRWHGVPLGGLGTGYITWDGDGRFGQYTIYNQVPTACPVPVAGTIPFRVRANGRSWALAMHGEDGQGDLVDLRYFGHYPVADLQFDLDGPLAVEIRSFAPFLPGNAAESNTPAVIFEAGLTNTGTESLEAEISFQVPSPPRPVSRWTEFTQDGWHVMTATHPWDQASPALGRPPVEHQVAVAVQGGQTQMDGSMTASFRVQLGPGEMAQTRFVLAWYQPYLRDNQRRAERLVYADRFAGVADIVRYAIAQHADWLRRIIAWQSAIYVREELPAWLREALVNSFYATCKNSHWIARTRPDDWFPADGLFLLNESYTTCPISETITCHYWGNFPVLFFFPELERTTLEAYRHFQLATGEVPFALDRGFGARSPYYQVQHNNGVLEYIYLIHRYWLRSGDDRFLRDFYPSARAALAYAEFLDYDHDGLVNEHAHAVTGEVWPANVPWDQWPQFGTSCYTGMKSITAYLSLAHMASHVGDEETVHHCRELAEQARARLEELHWNGEYYRLCIDPDTGERDEACLSAQTSGAWDARLLGLQSPVPEGRVGAALEAILRLTGHLSAYGLVLAATTDGAPVFSNYKLVCDFPRDVWPLFNFICAATCHYYGVAQEAGLAAAEKVTETIFRGPNAMPWGWPCNLNGFDGWIGHGHDYQDPQSIWTLPLAIAGQDIRAGVGPGSLVQAVLMAAASRETGYLTSSEVQ